MRCLECLEAADLVPCAIDDLFVAPKTPLQRGVLHRKRISTRGLNVVAVFLLTCDRTTTSSFVRWMSVSTASAPTSTAALKAPMVFSGCVRENPRCACENTVSIDVYGTPITRPYDCLRQFAAILPLPGKRPRCCKTIRGDPNRTRRAKYSRRGLVGKCSRGGDSAKDP